MESASGLKQAEGKISLTADKVAAYEARLEDLAFRAQRIASAAQNGRKTTDSNFGYELQNFRKEMRHFRQDIESLPASLSTLERGTFSPEDEKAAQSLARSAIRLVKGLTTLHERSLLAHQHIRAAEYKMDAWYLSQELEEMKQKAQSLPEHAARIIAAIMPPPG